jgi:hypothetical protein
MKTGQATAKLALCGVAAGLSAAVMVLGALVPVMTYALPALLGLPVLFLALEAGRPWALGVWLAVSTLGFLLAADKEVPLLYAGFFGHYPVCKALLEGRRLPRPLEWLCKLALFAAAMLVCYFVTVRVLGLPFEGPGWLGRWLAPAMLAAGAVVFVVFDVALTNGVTLYLRRWQKHVRRLFRFN